MAMHTSRIRTSVAGSPREPGQPRNMCAPPMLLHGTCTHASTPPITIHRRRSRTLLDLHARSLSPCTAAQHGTWCRERSLCAGSASAAVGVLVSMPVDRLRARRARASLAGGLRRGHAPRAARTPISTCGGRLTARRGALQASGVGVNDAVVSAFQEMKLGHKYRYVIYALNDASTEVTVLKTAPPETPYDEFIVDLPPNECRYAVHDFVYETKDGGKRNKLAFIVWCAAGRARRGLVRPQRVANDGGTHLCAQGTERSQDQE